MIYSHDIPDGSRLYFGKSAKLKRNIENIAIDILESNGFEEIITPFFSYHQTESLDKKKLIKLNDNLNRDLALRADSSIDVIRLVNKRLKSDSKKWFYIQPVFRYPSKEIYQIGLEYLDGNLEEVININKTIFDKLDINYTLQVSNIKIVHLVSKLTDLSLEDIKKSNIEKLSQIEWVKSLIYIHSKKDLEDLSIYPDEIKKELQKIKLAIQNIENVVIAPLFFANFNYYNGMFFRIINNNSLLSMGGEYIVESQKAVGFSIYTDSIIKLKELNG